MSSIPELARTLQLAVSDAGVNQSALSRDAGLSRLTTRRALSGEDDFRISTLLSLADQLGLDVVLVPKGASRGIAAPSTPQAYVPSVVDLALGRGGAR